MLQAHVWPAATWRTAISTRLIVPTVTDCPRRCYRPRRICACNTIYVPDMCRSHHFEWHVLQMKHRRRPQKIMHASEAQGGVHGDAM